MKVQIPYRAASGPLHLLMDSTGIKFPREGEGLVRKHGAGRRRQWRKLHIVVDADTLEVRAVGVTSSRIGDVEPVKCHRFKRTGEAFCRTRWGRSQLMSGLRVSLPMAFMTSRGAMPHRCPRCRCHHTSRTKYQGLAGR